MKRKFVLEKFCFFVKGAKRGAIYNLSSGDVYSIDENAVKFLDACEKGEAIEEVISNGFYLGQGEAIRYCRELETQNLGCFIGENDGISKIKLNKPHPLEFIWLEITNRCNLQCEHCYASSGPSKKNGEEMKFGDWVRVMEQAYEIGCRSVQFIGGEPFLHKRLDKLILKARSIGYEFIEVFTNGTLVTEDWVKFFLKNKVQVAISIYGPSAQIHDEITHRPGSFNLSTRTLKWLFGYSVPFRVALVVMKKNQDFVDETRKFLRENFGIKHMKWDIVRPSGRGCGIELVPEKKMKQRQMHKPDFSRCSKRMFERMRFGHQCFSKDVCITAAGEVFPCIMERDITLGDVLFQDLNSILNSNKANLIQGLNKDKVEVCKDCEYRYACFDCRPKAKGDSPNGNLYAKPAECHYNPYEGVWND